MTKRKKLTQDEIDQLVKDGWQLGYKVTDEMKSYLYFELDAWVRYAPMTITRRKKGCGPLGVIRFKKDLNHLWCPHPDLQAWRCLFKPSADGGFWKKDGIKRAPEDGYLTCFADAVILLDEVKVWKD